jgi:hypothetical protein
MIDILEILDYEVRSSWWASYISWALGQELSAKYFAWKVRWKYNRYKSSKQWEQRLHMAKTQ